MLTPTLEGVKLVITGRPTLTVKVTALDVPPPDGLTTVICAGPGLASSVDVIIAVSWVLLLYVV